MLQLTCPRTCTRAYRGTDHVQEWITTTSSARASRIIFLRWQISRGRKKERVAWTSTSYEKHKGRRRRRRRRTGASKAPERTCQPGGSTENDDRPLFPPSGLNYYHPAEHCLLWRRIILLSLGRPDSNTLRRGPAWRRRRGGAGGEGGYTRKDDCAAPGGLPPRFIDLTRENYGGYEKPTAKNQKADLSKIIDVL